MTTAEIKSTLDARGCTLVQAEGAFALVYPHGFGNSKRSLELLATTADAAWVEAWLWLHPESDAAEAVMAIMRLVATDYGVPLVLLRSRARHEPVATARLVAMALSREVTGATFELIGNLFERDRATAIYATDSINDRCTTDRALAARVGGLRIAAGAAVTMATAARE